jgi:hypothetical protein
MATIKNRVAFSAYTIGTPRPVMRRVSADTASVAGQLAGEDRCGSDSRSTLLGANLLRKTSRSPRDPSAKPNSARKISATLQTRAPTGTRTSALDSGPTDEASNCLARPTFPLGPHQLPRRNQHRPKHQPLTRSQQPALTNQPRRTTTQALTTSRRATRTYNSHPEQPHNSEPGRVATQTTGRRAGTPSQMEQP